MSDQIPRSARDDDAKASRFPRVLLFQILLVATSGGLGAVRLFREGSTRPSAFLMMIALPVASAIIAGSFSRPILEKPKPHWSVILTLPIMHLATLFALAALVRSRYTGIEVPNDVHPAAMWSEWPMLMASFLSQGVLVGLIVLALRAFVSRKQT